MPITCCLFVPSEPTVTGIPTGNAKNHHRECCANAFNRTREQVLQGSTDWAMAAVLKEFGPVMRRLEFEERCLELGMNQNTFYKYLSYSPIITKYGISVYGLRGAKIPPGVIESLRAREQKEKVTMDYGWTKEGSVWLMLRVSRMLLASGVFSIPSPMAGFLQGDFSLNVADGTSLGSVKIKGASGWSLTSFFRRRGGEISDYLGLIFELAERKATAYIDDRDLLDELFQEH